MRLAFPGAQEQACHLGVIFLEGPLFWWLQKGNRRFEIPQF